MMEILLSFDRTNDAIKAESLLVAAGIDVKVMNLPSAIKAGCGISLRVAPGLLAAADKVLCEHKVPVAVRHRRTVQNGQSTYTPLEENP